MTAVDIKKRVREELSKAGVTKYGLAKGESKFLYHSIGENEHILAVAYGKYTGGTAFLVATNLRVLFFDKKPFVNLMDEIAYHVVSGVKMGSSILPVTTLTLHTRIGDYLLKYVNQKCARKFAKIIEEKALEGVSNEELYEETGLIKKNGKMDDSILKFLKAHNIGVLSSVGRMGVVAGATVHYLVSNEGVLYFLTKEDTTKAHNIMANNQVAFTVYDERSRQTAQIFASCHIESDQKMMQHVFSEVTGYYARQEKTAPVAHLDKGKFVIFKMTPLRATFSDYSLERV